MALESELFVLFVAVVWGLVHISADSFSFKAQVGNAYTVGARDHEIERAKLAGRLHRAARNYSENFVLFAATVLLLHLTDRSGAASIYGAWAWMAGRVAYLFAYASGIPWSRTICWQISSVGLVVMLVQLWL